MPANELVLYQEEFQRLEHSLRQLRQDASARAVFVFDKSGQQILMDAASTRIGLTDRAGSNVQLDGASGNVLVRSAALVLINP